MSETLVRKLLNDRDFFNLKHDESIRYLAAISDSATPADLERLRTVYWRKHEKRSGTLAAGKFTSISSAILSVLAFLLASGGSGEYGWAYFFSAVCSVGILLCAVGAIEERLIEIRNMIPILSQQIPETLEPLPDR
jgi:hypothetical protein